MSLINLNPSSDKLIYLSKFFRIFWFTNSIFDQKYRNIETDFNLQVGKNW